MKDYQHSVVFEKSALDEKLARLTAFMASNAFVDLDQAEQRRLSRQADIMADYSLVLAQRIGALATPGRAEKQGEFDRIG